MLFLCPHRERASPTSVQKTAAPSAERCPEPFVGLIYVNNYYYRVITHEDFTIV